MNRLLAIFYAKFSVLDFLLLLSVFDAISLRGYWFCLLHLKI